jgi:hypothetical protein
MVMTTILRYVTRRSALAVLASATSVGLMSDLAAQSAVPSAAISGLVPEFNLSDIQLGEGEQIVSSSVEGGGVIQYGGGNYRMVDPGSFPTAAGSGGNPAAMPSMSGGFPLTGNPVTGNCASGNCGAGNCGSCGHGGYGYGGHGGHGTHLGGRPRVGSGGNVCGPTCNPYYYASVDALYMTNDGVEDFVGGPFNVSDYDYELGGRVTVGSVPNCRNGHEFSIVSPFRWRSIADGGPVPGINTFLVPEPVVAPLIPVNLSVFENPLSAQRQIFEAEYFSAELNRTLIGWEVIKLLYGVRYIQYDEEYLYAASIGPNPADQALLRSTTENRMIGGQVGLDMTYPLTCRLWSDMRARAGAYANFAENTFRVDNANVLQVFNRDDRTRLAGMFELGGGARYYLTNNFHVRAGGELWYLTQVATAVEQFGNVIGRGTGRDIRVNNDVLMFGVSTGAEWRF